MNIITPIAPPVLTLSFLQTEVWPLINTVSATFSLLMIVFGAWRYRFILAENWLTIVPLLAAAIGYGLFWLGVIEQAGLSNIVRPFLFVLFLTPGIATIIHLKGKTWTKDSK